MRVEDWDTRDQQLTTMKRTNFDDWTNGVNELVRTYTRSTFGSRRL